MIHASYCTPEMTALDQSAKQNGVVILTEMGLDPGIDHFLAMKCFHELQAEPGTKVYLIQVRFLILDISTNNCKLVSDLLY